MSVKLTPEVTALIDGAGADDLLEVVLELEPSEKPVAAAEAKSRTEKIAAQKEAFLRGVSPLEETIRDLGGEITGRAWINQSVRARVPASRVKELASLRGIAALDVPHPITAETR